MRTHTERLDVGAEHLMPTTLSEIIPKGTDSNMDCLLNEVVNWSCGNLMNINWYKTKEMVLGAKSALYVICVLMTMLSNVFMFLSYLESYWTTI